MTDSLLFFSCENTPVEITNNSPSCESAGGEIATVSSNSLTPITPRSRSSSDNSFDDDFQKYLVLLADLDKETMQREYCSSHPWGLEEYKVEVSNLLQSGIGQQWMELQWLEQFFGDVLLTNRTV